ncbi:MULTISPECIES: DUF6081 family protein [unclassified Streptomyces]|uniref:DUF6081 family protein n=1 Tax=unclassified Streptomyces TaxID=2593676 RepID=UPI002E17D922
MSMNRRTALTATAALAATALSAQSARAGSAKAAASAARRVLFEDDFSGGFATSGPAARWTHIPFGGGVGQDAVATTSRRGLRLAAKGANPRTGEPAFTLTLGQHETSGLPGTLDHIKWLSYPDRRTSEGTLGFSAEPGRLLVGESWMTATAYGTAAHPFGSAVADALDDPRLAMAGLPVEDQETGIAVDFFFTNRSVYAFYERLPNHRDTLGNYAAFTYAVPVARRSSPTAEHHIAIEYDRSRGIIRWRLDGREVFKVDRIGHLLPSRRYLLLDHGGTPASVTPRQLTFGLGMFDALDFARPGVAGSGLVRLTTEEGHYFDPVRGEPAPQSFLDDAARPENRLWGQGAALGVRRFLVSSRNSG